MAVPTADALAGESRYPAVPADLAGSGGHAASRKDTGCPSYHDQGRRPGQRRP
jgi:hypothetical protein